MFGRIAARYDLLNHLLSLGVDRRWRRSMLECAGDLRGRLAVDACCGTGDVTLALARAGARAVGVDFTPQMLARAREKGLLSPATRAVFAQGDALCLPVRTGSADVCTVAFGIRNVADREQALREMMRVLRPGGRVLLLEFTMPPGRILRALYRAYFVIVLPAIGRCISRDRDAYSYLPRSVLGWPAPSELEREMRSIGLEECTHRLLSRGIACVHSARTPEGVSA